MKVICTLSLVHKQENGQVIILFTRCWELMNNPLTTLDSNLNESEGFGSFQKFLKRI